MATIKFIRQNRFGTHQSTPETLCLANTRRHHCERYSRKKTLPFVGSIGKAIWLVPDDYSVRSPLEGRGDEFGILAKAFNHMLSRISRQDAVLNLSQQKLESLVNPVDGIVWEWNPRDCPFTFISRQSERIVGYSPERIQSPLRNHPQKRNPRSD